jgi:predicted nucleic acid-binding Zn ribbon protein
LNRSIAVSRDQIVKIIANRLSIYNDIDANEPSHSRKKISIPMPASSEEAQRCFLIDTLREYRLRFGMLPAPRECLICQSVIEFPARSDKEYCSDACRSLHWQRQNRVPIATFTVADFAGLQAVLARNEARLGRKAKLIGYSLRAPHPARCLSGLGEVSFPDPNRKTKRFPDESGVARVRREPYFRYAPFEPARVPCVGHYCVTLYFDDGSTESIGDVKIDKAFPSVRFYDQEGNFYDLKGKLIPNKGSSATPKPHKKYVPRKLRTVPTDPIVPVEPSILEHIRVAVALAMQAEREADRMRVEATQRPDDNEQAVSLRALVAQVTTLTAKLNAAEARAIQAERVAKEQVSRAEARERVVKEELAQAEARLEHAATLMAHHGARPTPLHESLHLLQAQVAHFTARAESAEQERFLMAQRLKVLENRQQAAPSAVSAPTSQAVAPPTIKPVPAQTTKPPPPPLPPGLSQAVRGAEADRALWGNDDP